MRSNYFDILSLRYRLGENFSDAINTQFESMLVRNEPVFYESGRISSKGIYLSKILSTEELLSAYLIENLYSTNEQNVKDALKIIANDQYGLMPLYQSENRYIYNEKFVSLIENNSELFQRIISISEIYQDGWRITSTLEAVSAYLNQRR